MSSDELITYTEDHYDDLVENFVAHNQELFDSFCMEEMDKYNAGRDEDDDRIDTDLLE